MASNRSGSEESPSLSVGTTVSVVQRELHQAFFEFDLMLRYVLSTGGLDADASKAVIGVQKLVLAQAGRFPPDAEQGLPFSANVAGLPPNLASALPDSELAESLMTAHTALARLISPATPLSLAATEPSQRFGYLGNPPLLRIMIIIAMISALGLLVTSILMKL
jgi:hypothetical protein